jgi:hypothetical protein
MQAITVFLLFALQQPAVPARRARRRSRKPAPTTVTLDVRVTDRTGNACGSGPGHRVGPPLRERRHNRPAVFERKAISSWPWKRTHAEGWRDNDP